MILKQFSLPYGFTLKAAGIPPGGFLLCLGVWNLDIRRLAEIVAEEKRERSLKANKKKHKCNSCPWSSWAGNKFVCMFSHCVKDNGFK